MKPMMNKDLRENTSAEALQFTLMVSLTGSMNPQELSKNISICRLLENQKILRLVGGLLF